MIRNKEQRRGRRKDYTKKGASCRAKIFKTIISCSLSPWISFCIFYLVHPSSENSSYLFLNLPESSNSSFFFGFSHLFLLHHNQLLWVPLVCFSSHFWCHNLQRVVFLLNTVLIYQQRWTYKCELCFIYD